MARLEARILLTLWHLAEVDGGTDEVERATGTG